MDQPHSHHESSYQTGRTQVPKSHRGIIAFLLVLVIFLCGISTALGLMNIQMFRQLKEQLSGEDAALAFNRTDCTESTAGSDPVRFGALGVSGETLSDFWQQYMDLPQGVYITGVTDRAEAVGLQPGDILLRFRGVLTQSAQTLSDLLAQCTDGETAELVIYRDGQQKTVCITIENTP